MKERIQKLMEAFDLSAFALEHIAHLSNATLSAPLKKGGNIGELAAFKICYALSVNYDWIMNGEGPVFNTSSESACPKIYDIMFREGLSVSDVERLTLLPKGGFRALLDPSGQLDAERMASSVLERLLAIYPSYAASYCVSDNSHPSFLPIVGVGEVADVEKSGIDSIKGEPFDLAGAVGKGCFIVRHRGLGNQNQLLICSSLQAPYYWNYHKRYVIMTSDGQLRYGDVTCSTTEIVSFGDLGDDRLSVIDINVSDIMAAAMVVGLIQLF